MNVIKKKNYYYLRHSFRRQGKVITKEKYLGKKIPGSIEEIKHKFLEDIKKVTLYDQLRKIKTGFQKEWKEYPPSIKAKLKEQIAISFTYNTNAIEGSKITLEETREIVEEKIAPNRPIREIKETEAHVKVFLKMLEKREKLDNNLLLKWHKELFSETKPDIAGKYRDYLIGVADYIAPDWQDVKKLMKAFIGFYNKNKKISPVELAGRLHYKFEKVHPFGDGNGRIGRLIINYILWHNKYPMIIIEYKKRRSYYKAFNKDEKNFLNYFIRRYLNIHKKYWKN